MMQVLHNIARDGIIVPRSAEFAQMYVMRHKRHRGSCRKMASFPNERSFSPEPNPPERLSHLCNPSKIQR